MILLLDNHDSFVHNLARYFRLTGLETRVVRSDTVGVSDVAEMSPSAIVISPGPKRPEDAGCSIDVIQKLGTRIPILGVCLGHQAIGVAFGGQVIECDPVHGIASSIAHDHQGIFRDCPSPMNVGRYHSLAIERATLPACLEVAAITLDGVIMGVRHREYPIHGLQFHPESILSGHGQTMVGNFCRVATEYLACL